MKIRIEDRILRGLFRRARRDAKQLAPEEAYPLIVRRDIVVAAMRLRSKRDIDRDERRKAASYLIAVLNSTAALKALTNYLKPKKAPIGRLVAEDYLVQRALGEKAEVANKIVREAWSLTEKVVKDHVTNWRSAAAKSVKLLTEPDARYPWLEPADLRSHVLNLRRSGSVAQRVRGETFEQFSRKRNTVKFRPRIKATKKE